MSDKGQNAPRPFVGLTDKEIIKLVAAWAAAWPKSRGLFAAFALVKLTQETLLSKNGGRDE